MTEPGRPDKPPEMSYGAAQARYGQRAGLEAHYGAGEKPAATTERNKLGTFALVSGILALLALLFPVTIALPVGIIASAAALWFGVQSVRATSRGEANNRAQGVTGLVLGGFAALLYVPMIVVAFLAGGVAP